MTWLRSMEQFPLLFLTHLRANWKRGFIMVLGLFGIVLILNEAIFVASSSALYSFTNEPPEGAIAPESALNVNVFELNMDLFGEGFPRTLTQMQQDAHSLMKKAIAEAQFKVKGDVTTSIMLDAQLYTWMQDLTTNQSFDDTFVQFRVIGLDEELLKQLELPTSGATLVVLDRLATSLAPLSEQDRNKVNNQWFSLPENETVYKVIGDGYRYGDYIELPYELFEGEKTIYVRNYYAGEFYGDVLHQYLTKNTSLVLRSAPSKQQSSLVASWNITELQYHAIPRLLNDVGSQQFYESSPLLASLVAIDFISVYGEGQGAFLIVPSTMLYSYLDSYYRSHSIENSPYNGLEEIFVDMMPMRQISALFDFSVDLDFYANHMDTLSSDWYRVEEKMRINGEQFARRLIPSSSTTTIGGRYYLEIGFSSPYDLSDRVSTANATFFAVFLYLLILGIPVFILALLAGNFATNLAKHELYRQVTLYRLRGMQKTQVFMLLLAELLVMLIASTVLSFFGAIPLVLLILSSRGILQFDFNPITLIIPTDWLMRVLLVGIVLGFLLRIRAVWRVSHLPIKQVGTAPTEEEPFWKRKYLDLVAMVWGGGGVFFALNLQIILAYFQNAIPLIFLFILALCYPFHRHYSYYWGSSYS